MAVRRTVELPLGDDLVPHPGPDSPGEASQGAFDTGAVAFLLRFGLGLVDVDDVRRPRRRIAELERLRLRLDVPRIVRAPLDPRPAEPDRPRPRQPAELGRMPRPADEHLEPVRASPERVLLVVGQVDDAVARPELVHLLVLPGEARPAEHEDDLLGRAVRVGRGRQPARIDPDAVHTDRRAAHCIAEPLPARRHLALLAAARLGVVPVRDVVGSYCSSSF